MTPKNYSTENQIAYSHLTLTERIIIQKYYYEDRSLQFIATKLGRSKSTISYELHHNGQLKQDKREGRKFQHKYYAKTAHNKATDSGRRNKISESNKMYMKDFKKLAKKHPTYSIEALYYLISSESKPCLRTFYYWLYLGYIDCIQYKRLRKKKDSKFNDSNDRVNISKREKDFGFTQNDYSNSVFIVN